MSTRSISTRRSFVRFDSIEQEAFLNVWRTYDRLRVLEDELFARFELTSQQYNVLRLLRTQQPDGWPTLQLASRLVSRAPDITRMLDRLEEMALIERHRQADRRVVVVKITASGAELLDRIAEPLRDCHKRQLGHMAAADLRQLSRLLRAARTPHEPDGSDWK
jgi:DNA-binding MarR family transcriptional regulator